MLLRNLIQSIGYTPQKEVLLDVPYVSAIPGNCGIGCIAMIVGTVTVEQLEKKYKTLPFYDERLGWTHKGLMTILDDYGIASSYKKRQSLKDLERCIGEGKPVVVSLRVPVYGGHLCVVIGIREKGFVMHDPRDNGQSSKEQLVPFRTFARWFTGRGIVVEK